MGSEIIKQELVTAYTFFSESRIIAGHENGISKAFEPDSPTHDLFRITDKTKISKTTAKTILNKEPLVITHGDSRMEVRKSGEKRWISDIKKIKKAPIEWVTWRSMVLD